MGKKRGTSLTLATAAAMAVIVPGSPADASYPTCNYSRTTAAYSGGQVIVPSVQSTGSITCVLGYGNAGRAVKRLQMSLNACYYGLYFVQPALKLA